MRRGLHVALLVVAVMIRGAAEDGHCIELRGAPQHLVERSEDAIAPVAVAQRLAAVGAQIWRELCGAWASMRYLNAATSCSSSPAATVLKSITSRSF